MRNVKTRRLVHVSFDCVERFVPRIPKTAAEGEDTTIPRICVTDSITHGLQAMAWAGKTLTVMQKLGLPLIVHAYYMSDDHVLAPDIVQQFVPDAKANHEHWLTECPKIIRRVDYELVRPKIFVPENKIDWEDYRVERTSLRRLHFTDNAHILAERLSVEDAKLFAGIVRKAGYCRTLCYMERELVSALGEERIA